MSNLPQQDTITQYVGDGVTASYVFDFYVPVDPATGRPDIDVYVTLSGATAVPTSDIKTWGIDYNVSFNPDPTTGGTVTFVTLSIPALDSVVTLNRNVTYSLNTEFADAQNFNGANLDAALQRLLLLIQQNRSYNLFRNLSYIIDDYLPEVGANTQIPVLGNGEIWIGQGGGVISSFLEQNPDVSTLRTDLENEAPVTNGAGLVGYYDTVNDIPTTVKSFLDNIVTLITDLIVSNIENTIYDDTGAVNALAISIPFFTGLAEGNRFYIKPANDSSSLAPTLSINSGTPILINQRGSSTAVQKSLAPADITASSVIELVSPDGVSLTLMNPQSQIKKIFYGAQIYLSANQSFPISPAIPQILFDQIFFDPFSICNVTHGFTIKLEGYYNVRASVDVSIGYAGATWLVFVYVNGTLKLQIGNNVYPSFGTENTNVSGSDIVYLNIGDIVDIRAQQAGTGSTSIIGNNTFKPTNASIEYLGI